MEKFSVFFNTIVILVLIVSGLFYILGSNPLLYGILSFLTGLIITNYYTCPKLFKD